MKHIAPFGSTLLAWKGALWSGRFILCLAETALFTAIFAAANLPAQTNLLIASATELKRYSLEQLMSIDVTSVSRQPEPWFTSPSAIQVITSEEIRRSGATSLPEALRLAPNLQIAQADSSTWSITAR